jgi:hypothetical protein
MDVLPAQAVADKPTAAMSTPRLPIAIDTPFGATGSSAECGQSSNSAERVKTYLLAGC